MAKIIRVNGMVLIVMKLCCIGILQKPIYGVDNPKNILPSCEVLKTKPPAIQSQDPAPYESVKQFYKQREFKNKLFSLAYLFLILIMVSCIVSLYVYLECRQFKMEKAIANNILRFNISEMKSTENTKGKIITGQAKSNSTEEYHLRKGYLLTITYQVDNEDEVLKYICVISITLLILSVVCLPFVIYNHMENKVKEVYSDIDRNFKMEVMEINLPDMYI
ncbi:uncharacterized protein TNIN_282661 [Trichonephila inaurata madagascariensis]|uniref:Uncharacterized protein n=1 Tax=Trichonephila inaurata madagascariensis TaxID=2747483 RepID=A0A8X6MBE2_9ARAC|nr:uncharacterized protein TNIN_282661 [Trichonephila inaurata madagascariensis]